MAYRLALDLGTNSIGWAQFSINEKGHVGNLIDGGVHIFDQGRNPKSLGSNAADRRLARGLRRNRDRKNRRKRALLTALVAYDLLPAKTKDQQALTRQDPYAIRERGLSNRLTPHEFGRALFHLHQRRGFRSNRKFNSNEDGKIAKANGQLSQKLEESGFETYGAFLAHRHREGLPTRLRLQGKGAKAAYEFYPTRDMILHEFNLLFDKQRSLGLQAASPKAQEELKKIFFRQRPLKSPLVGRCSFLPDEDRAPKSLPTAQRFRIWSEVLNLRIVDATQNSRPLTHGQVLKVVEELCKKKDCSFERLGKLLDLNPNETFNLKSKRRTKLRDQTAAAMRSPFKQHISLKWDALTLPEQDEVVEKLLGDENDEELIAWLKGRFTLIQDQAKALAQISPLPTRSHLSAEAMRRIVAVYEEQLLPYDDAVKAAGLGHHSDRRTSEVFDFLPYYGAYLRDAVAPLNPDNPRNDVERYGKFPNPTVHIVLGRLRALVNALVKRDGKPAEIVIESGRDLPLSAKARKELEKEQKKNTQANEERAKHITALGQQVTHDALLKLALYEELGPDAQCIYSGEKICPADALSHRIEIEHILPFSRTLDDSRTNKTLDTRHINREKGNRSPFEAFGHKPEYNAILERVQNLPKNKRWRFGENAMSRFEEENQWLARQLTDTQYVARLAVRYLTPICETFDGKNVPVWATPGRLTEQVRRALGLNEVLGLKGKKNRNDHRHHFVDACVIGLMDRGLLQKVSRAARHSDDEKEQNQKIADFITQALGTLKDPLREAVKARAADMVIAHRPDHAKAGQLLKETAYGFIKKAFPQTAPDLKEKSTPNVSLRVPFPKDESKSDGSKSNEFKSIEDLSKILSTRTHAKLHQRIWPALEAGIPFQEAAEAAANALNIKKIRIGLRETVEPISVDGDFIKGYASGGNWAYDFYQCPYDGFGAELINLRTANGPGFAPPWKTKHPEAKRLMRLFGGDMIEIDDPRPGKEKARTIFRIQKMTSGAITLCEPQEANADKRQREGEDKGKIFFSRTSKTLWELGVKKLYVSVLGEVRGRTSHR